MIHAFLREDAGPLDDQVYDAVRAEIEQKRQRVVIGPWRVPDMNKLVPIGLGAAAVIAVLVIGSQFLGPRPSGRGRRGSLGRAFGAAPSTTPPAGIVHDAVLHHHRSRGRRRWLKRVSGTARLTTLTRGTHTVRCGMCHVRDGRYPGPPLGGTTVGARPRSRAQPRRPA